MVLSYYTGPESWRCCGQVHQFITPVWESLEPHRKESSPIVLYSSPQKTAQNRYMSPGSRLNWQARRHQLQIKSSCSNFGQDRSKNVNCNTFNITPAKAARTSPHCTYCTTLYTGGSMYNITMMGHRDGKVGVMYTAPSKNLNKETKTWI